MRIVPKYKIFFSNNVFLTNSFKKLQNFKRSKWVTYKKIIKKNLIRKNFINFSLSFLKLKMWEKRKHFFRKHLRIKRILSQHTDYSSCFKSIKNNLDYNSLNYYNLNYLKQTFLKLEFRLDILINRLNFFSSISESKFFITTYGILINDVLIKNTNYFCKKGDIIHFNKIDINNNAILSKQLKLAVFYTFIEIDYYTNTFVVVKNLDELSLEDISLFYPKYADLSNICHIFSL